MKASNFLPILDWGRQYDARQFSDDVMAAFFSTIMERLVPWMRRFIRRFSSREQPQKKSTLAVIYRVEGSFPSRLLENLPLVILI